jgi:leucyl aminopeptidase
MLPGHLATVAQQVAAEHGATCRILTGGELLGANYPMVYMVGKASADAPRLIDIRWGNPANPKVTLVGKGVCFDSGGLDIKNASNMKLMKKDMGGAAITLALAQLIMAMKLPVSLRLMLPAVENAISGNAMRPLDIVRSRKGITVEIGDTDAEGRLILADCLWEASQEKPDLLIDIATLTGAARVAVGTEMPALFCNNGDLAGAIIEAGRQADEYLWPLPLHSPYRAMLDSKIADLSSTPSSGYGGAITAALFLQEFVEPGIPWVHLDTMAWNLRTLPGRPEGGEAQCLRALWKYLSNRFVLAA